MQYKFRRLDNGAWHIWERGHTACNRGQKTLIKLRRAGAYTTAELEQTEFEEAIQRGTLQEKPICNVCAALSYPHLAHWAEAGPGRRPNQKQSYALQRRSLTIRVSASDHKLLRALGNNEKTRHEALLELIPIIANLELPPKDKLAIRLLIPSELDAAIQTIIDKTRSVDGCGYTFQAILLAAVRQNANTT